MNKTYQYISIIIESKKYSYEELFSKLDLFFMLGRISESEYMTLAEKMNEGYVKGEAVNLEELED
jgi:hypothetical protein